MNAQSELRFAGPTLNRADLERLGLQQRRVTAFMLDGAFHTLREISEALRVPEASVSARLRTLRTMGHVVERRRAAPNSGLWRYRLVSPETAA